MSVVGDSSKTIFPAPMSSYGITLYQFTEHYITNANTVPVLILFFLYDVADGQTAAL